MAKSLVARMFRGTPRNLAFLARQLAAGELVGVPTETVYGLAANALDAAACRQIFRAKRRPQTDPLIVHLASAEDLHQVCVPNRAAVLLATAFWPGPLTLVLPKLPNVPDVVTAGRDSVAVRVPSHPVFRRLLRLARLPLAAPSANPFGYVSPTTAEHVRESLGGRIRFILDGGASHIGLESTIVDLRDERRPRLLRPGAVTRHQIERALGCRVAVVKHAAGEAEERGQVAPGMLTRHYSPRTPVVLHPVLNTAEARAKPGEAFVFLRRPAKSAGRRGGAARSGTGRSRAERNVFFLDERGDLRAAARRLFATLRRLDGAGFARMHVELAPADGIGEAINDRLRRAAAR